MNKQEKRNLISSAILLACFLAWTLAVRCIDRQAIGPQGSFVGFAWLNAGARDLLGTRMGLYQLTDLLSIIPLAIALGFALLGLVQWIKRKHFLMVDGDLLALGVFYLAVMGCYLLFEVVILNYRPILIDGVLEASYPSSTTLLVMCIMPTAAMQFRKRIKGRILKKCVLFTALIFSFLMVAGRIFSGVHWITDIIGGILLSASLITAYRALEIRSDAFLKSRKK